MLAIKIENVKKKYRLGAIGGTTLTADLQSWWARKRGLEDPNSKIGTNVNLETRNQTFWALKGLNLEVKEGEVVGIIGRNGAGKSTLLKLISKVTAPTEGKILLNGRVASMLEVGTGFNQEMTGRENIYLNGAILGMTNAEVDKKIEEIIDFSECRQFIDTPVKRYSSGMYVKLAFSVAAHLDSEIMLMDEVLAVGDMAFQQKCLRKMKSVSTELGRTILYVSHNMATIRELCDRCIVLDQGQIIYNGEVETAIQYYMNAFSDMSIHNDVSKMKRDTTFYTQYIHTTEINILDKENMNFTCDEKIHCEAVFTSDIDIEKVYLRVFYFYKDGTRLGMCTTTKPFSVKKDVVSRQEFYFNIENLPSGIYYSAFTFYRSTGTGQSDNLDVVSPAFYFETANEGKNTNNLIWRHRQWGSVVFPEIDITD